MKIDFKETGYDTTSSLEETVKKEDSKLKELIVQYVGEKIQPEEENITVEDIIDIFADEFPEFILALAEENWIRGYNQGIGDRIIMHNTEEENREH